MASLTLHGPGYGQRIFSQEYFSVWVKPAWGNDWEFVPYLQPDHSSECAAPSISEASFTWDYGEFLNLWYDAGGTLVPLNLQNWFIAILVHSEYETSLHWIGVVTEEAITDEGVDSTSGAPQGVQEIHAQGLEWLLERRVVAGCYASNSGGASYYLPRTRPFNLQEGRGKQIIGNRSLSAASDSGFYTFNGTARWSNLQILQYLLYHFQPTSPTWYISGQAVNVLSSIYDVHDFRGETIRSAIDSLIDRKRGLGYHLTTNGVGGVYIYVFSLLQDALTVGSMTIPANTSQLDVAVNDDLWIQSRLKISSLGQYDSIVVEGDEPIKGCFSASVVDLNLVEGWSSGEENAYIAADDEGKQSDLYRRVFQYYRLPSDFDLGLVAPFVDAWGNVYPSTAGSYLNLNHVFLRWLPFYEDNDGTSYGLQNVATSQELREPFAIVRQENLAAALSDDGNAPYSASEEKTLLEVVQEVYSAATAESVAALDTNSDDSITADEIVAGIRYMYVDKMDALGYSPASLRPHDHEMGLFLNAKANHVFAKNVDTFADSATAPQVDYTTLAVTVCVETDEMPKVSLGIFWDGVKSPTGKTIYITVPGIEVWVVAPDTIYDVVDGEVVYWGDSPLEYVQGTKPRDDSAYLLRIAYLAWFWYGQQRAACTFEIANNLKWFSPGDLVRTVWYGTAWERIGTCVTRVLHDYQENTQTVETGYGELDPQVFADEFTA